jgi:hypothetical protein
MSTKRPSITVLSDIIQKYVGSDYDRILEAANTIEQFLATSTNATGQTTTAPSSVTTITTNLNTEVNYDNSLANTLDELLQELLVQVNSNTEGLESVDELNTAVATNSASIAEVLLQLEQFLGSVLSGKTYQGGYDAATNTPNLEAPPLETVLQGFVYDVTAAGIFNPAGGGSGDVIEGINFTNVDTAGITDNTYTVTDGVELSGGFGTGLAVNITVSGGEVIAIDSIVNPGTGYTNNDLITITAGVGVLDGSGTATFQTLMDGSIQLVVGDTLRANNDNPLTLGEWTVIPFVLLPASIKVQYELNPDTNAFTDALKTKLEEFPETFNTLDDAYRQGSVITIDDEIGSIVIDQLNKTAPALRILPNNDVPTTELYGGAIHLTEYGDMYVFDDFRQKFLSVAEVPYHFSYNGDLSKDRDEYLSIATIVDYDTGFVIPRDGTIVGIRARAQKNRTSEYQIILDKDKDNPAYTFNLAQVGDYGEFDEVTVNVDVDDSQDIQVLSISPEDTGESGRKPRRPLVSLYIKWRL